MPSKPITVDQYLASLPEDRRAAISAVRDVILENLGEGYEEGIQYGMIGYYVPHAVYPAGYHVDPKQPLPFDAPKKEVEKTEDDAVLGADEDLDIDEGEPSVDEEVDLGGDDDLGVDTGDSSDES